MSHDHFQLEMGLLGSAGRQDEKEKLKLKYATFEGGFCRFSEILRIPERSKRGNYRVSHIETYFMNSDSLNMVSRLGEGHMSCNFFLSEPQLKTTVV